MKKQFIEIPASKKSITNRRLICGVGINDATYEISRLVDGKRVLCPYYLRWKNMLTRCYSEKYNKEHPTYIDCKACGEWLTFSVFKKWMVTQEWKGKHLDKDIVKLGNKTYSPKNCRFITVEVNTLLNDSGSNRGKYPQGVCLNKQTGTYRAQINFNKTRTLIGLYKTPEQASNAYVKKKTELISLVASEQSDPLIAAGLLAYAKALQSIVS